MAWEKTKWACGHEGYMQLYGKMSGREARVAYEAGRQCMACWLVEQWENEDDPRAKMEDRYKLAAAIAENKGKRINVSDSVPVKATNQPAEEENKMAEKKKSAGKGKGAAAAAAAAAKAKAKKQEETAAAQPKVDETAAAAEKSQAHKVLDALFATVLDEKDRPDTSAFTEEQISKELHDNSELLRAEDKPAILSLDEGEMIWDFLCGLRKELAGEKVAKQTKADKKTQKVEKPKKEKKVKHTTTKDRDKYGFIIGSNGHKFVEFLKTGPKTMRECQDAPWNPTRATFMDPMKKLITNGKAVKHQDGKIELIG